MLYPSDLRPGIRWVPRGRGMDSSIRELFGPWSGRKHKMCCLTETGRTAERYELYKPKPKRPNIYLPSRGAVIRVLVGKRMVSRSGPSLHIFQSFQHLRRRIKFIFDPGPDKCSFFNPPITALSLHPSGTYAPACGIV